MEFALFLRADYAMPESSKEKKGLKYRFVLAWSLRISFAFLKS